MKRIRMEDVAKRAGVSKATVSLALSDNPLVSDKTRLRVKRIAELLGYEPNPHAQRLAKSRSGQIGLIVPDIENVYYASLMRHMNLELQRAGYSMLCSISENAIDTEELIVREMLRNVVDAILLVPTHGVLKAPPSIEMLLRSNTPAVFVTSKYDGAGIPCVMCDLAKGMNDLSSMLYSQGRKRQVLLTYASGAIAFAQREAGFVAALAQSDAKATICRVDQITYESAFTWAENCCLSDLDAILCVNDMMALGVLDALKQRGVSIPGDIAVAGFDDVIFSRITSTPITTVRQDIAQLCRLSVEHVIARIQGHEPVEDIYIPCKTIQRMST